MLRITRDGSHTLFSPVANECYHSQFGAMRESEHVFIQAGWENCLKSDLRIFEVGFGTGLNAFLSLLRAEKDRKKVHYSSLELYPIEMKTAEELNYFELTDKARKADFLKLHLAEWNKTTAITPFFSLEKIRADFSTFEPTGFYDLFYFDAFSPEKQPEMWTQGRFETLYAHANADATLVTYCAKGSIRRALQSAGFEVERLPGPPGKREMLRARKFT